MDRAHELENQVAQLTRTVKEMRARMAKLEGGQPGGEQGSARSSRRGFFKLGTAAAATALGWVALKAVPASAANGGNTLLGTANLAASPTTIQGDIEAGPIGPPVQVLAAIDSTFSASALTAAGGFGGTLQGLGAATGQVEGVNGWAQGPQAFAVYGLTDSGTGVVGESNTGIGLYARRSGRIRQEGVGGPGNPGYMPNLFEQVRDSNGVLWIHNPTGVWRRVNTLRVDAADGLGGVFKPFRRLDTRSGARKAVGSLTLVSIAGQGTGASTIPADAVAAVGNLTATAYTGGGWLAIMPAGITVGTGAGQFNPAVGPSSINFLTGQAAVANSFICGLGGGALQVYVAGSPSHFIVDITAYIQ